MDKDKNRNSRGSTSSSLRGPSPHGLLGAGRKLKASTDYAVKLRTASTNDRWEIIGEALNKTETRLNSSEGRAKNAERVATDAQRLYSKYCLTMTGSDMPAKPIGIENCVDTWITTMDTKYGIKIREEERMQFRNCHRDDKGTGLIAAFTSVIDGSVFDRCASRGPRNWNGELTGSQSTVNMKVSVDRVCAKADREIKSMALYMKNADKAKARIDKRVEQYSQAKSGIPSIRTGYGKWKNIYHIEQASAMMTTDEINDWSSRQKRHRRGPGGGGASQGGNRKGKGTATGGNAEPISTSMDQS